MVPKSDKTKPVTIHTGVSRFHLIARKSHLIIICIVGFIIYSNSFECSFHLSDITS